VGTISATQRDSDAESGPRSVETLNPVVILRQAVLRYGPFKRRGKLPSQAKSSCGLLPTVAEVLVLPALAVGAPEVLAGKAGLSGPVRWAHVSELTDIAGLLAGQELILTTGIALPDSSDGLREYVDTLAGAAAAGLVVELGRRYERLPSALVRACEARGLPLVALRRQVRFVKVTEAIHAKVLYRQIEGMQLSEAAHARFTDLTLSEASVQEIVDEAARLLHGSVVLEDLGHRPVAQSSSDPAADLLLDWENRSRDARAAASSAVAGHENWGIAEVTVRGQRVGRLVLLSPGTPTPPQLSVLARAAAALAMQRLQERSGASGQRQSHRTLLIELIEGRCRTAADVHARTASVGVPTARRILVALWLDVIGRTSFRLADLDQQAERLAAAIRSADLVALTGPLGDERVGALLSLTREADRTAALRALAERLPPPDTNGRLVLAAGSSVCAVEDVGRSFAEATQVLEAARGLRADKQVFELADIRLRGLLVILRHDPLVQDFAERSLGPLLQYDARHDSELFGSVRAYLAHNGSKSAAAKAARVSRQTMYEHLAIIERILGLDLDAADERTSLHAVIMVREANPGAHGSGA